MLKIRFFFVIVTVTTLFLNCGFDEKRKIKLASRDSSSFMKNRVTTIQVSDVNRKTVAVLHFTNFTKNKKLDWLEQGIVEMMITDLSQSRQLNIISSSMVAEAFTKLGYSKDLASDPKIASEIANYLEAEAVICGRYSLKKDSLEIGLELVDSRSADVTHQLQVTGAGLGNVFTMVDQLIRDLKKELQITIRENREIDESKAHFATRSVEAYKYYAQGVELMNKFYHRDAGSYFKKAIELDSSFTSAYLKLASCCNAIKRDDEARALLTQALKYIDQAPPKERLRIQAFESTLRGDFLKSIEIYKQMTELYPEDDEAHNFLAEYLKAFNQNEKAAEHLEMAVALNPKNKLAYNSLGYTYAELGRINYAIGAIEKYIQLAKDEPNPYDSMGEILLHEGKIDRAIDYFKKALEKDESYHHSLRHLAHSYLDKGDTDRAEKIAEQVLKSAKTEMETITAYHLKSDVEIAKGSKKNALKNLKYIIDNIRNDNFITFQYASLLDDQKEKEDFIRNIVDLMQTDYEFSDNQHNKVFLVVNLCLESGVCLEKASHFCQKLFAKSTSSLIKLQAKINQMVVEMNKQDPSMERISQIQDSVHVHLSKIPSPAKWDSFWKYYHRGIKNLYEKELIDDFYKEFTLKDYRYENKSITIPMSLGFAQYKYLTGQIDESKQIFETLGVPPEDSWWISEPFNVSQGFNQTFWPEEKDMSQIMAQKDLDEFWIRKFDGINDGFIKVDRIREMDINQAVYAVLPLYSSRPLNIKIQLSASQPFMLWVNNHLLVTKNKKESPLIDKYSVMTNMRSGTNWLVVKLIGRVGPFGFYLRTTDENGNHVPQLTHYLDSQPTLSLALKGENE